MSQKTINYDFMLAKAKREIKRLIKAQKTLKSKLAIDHAVNAASTVFHLIEWHQKKYYPNKKASRSFHICKHSKIEDFKTLHDIATFNKHATVTANLTGTFSSLSITEQISQIISENGEPILSETNSPLVTEDSKISVHFGDEEALKVLNNCLHAIETNNYLSSEIPFDVFKRSEEYSEKHLLDLAAEKLFSAKWLFLHPISFFSAGYLIHLTLELILKACCLHFKDQFPRSHDLCEILKILSLNIQLNEKDKGYIKEISKLQHLRYETMEIGTDADSQLNRIISSILNQMPEEFGNIWNISCVNLMKTHRYIPQRVFNDLSSQFSPFNN